jgi:hypothetical protein
MLFIDLQYFRMLVVVLLGGIILPIAVYEILDEYTTILLVFGNIAKAFRRQYEQDQTLGPFVPIVEIFLRFLPVIIVVILLNIVAAVIIFPYWWEPPP